MRARRAYIWPMRRLIIGIALIVALSVPVAAQEAAPDAGDGTGASLMERGAEMFFDGLRQELGPALGELRDKAGEAAPALREFMQQMGPALVGILARIEDLSAYAPPEMLPNGDIIIRRKTPLVPETAPQGETEI